MAGSKLDPIDRQILAELQADGRMTNVELAKRVGISAPPCLRRVRTLEEAGFIKGYHADIDARELGFEVQVFAMVRLHSQAESDLSAFEARCRAWPLVRECHMLNGEIDFILKCVAPDLSSFQSFLTGALLTTKTAPWRFEDWMVLVGDSAHAVYPFYGQGMNSAFEDCSALLAALKAHPVNRAAAFAAYEQARRPHTDVLMELSKANFIELRQKVSSPWFLARKRLDVLLNRLLPGMWLPIYTMVSHTTMPYADALARARRQDRILGAVATGMVLAIGGGLWWGLRG